MIPVINDLFWTNSWNRVHLVRNGYYHIYLAVVWGSWFYKDNEDDGNNDKKETTFIPLAVGTLCDESLDQSFLIDLILTLNKDRKRKEPLWGTKNSVTVENTIF